jgi:small nuclear ribonucleoprotein (snRNP)-like protein
MAREGGGNILPLSNYKVEFLDKCDGNKVWIILQDNKEISGNLRAHDENFNMIIDNVREL